MKSPIIIPISGKARHGKDTVANELARLIREDGKRPLIIRYADYLKMVAKLYFGWDGEKDEKGRTLLQQLGTEMSRAKDPDFWVDIVMSFIDLMKDEFDAFLIPDARFPNEVDECYWNGTDFSIRAVRKNFDNGLTEEQKNHPSETALDNYDFDVEIVASDMDGLLDAVGEVYQKQIKRLF